MKKLFALFVSVFLIASLMAASFVSANEKNTEFRGMTDTWWEITTTMDDSDHGGMYIKDNVLHIMPVNIENVEKVVDSAKSKMRDADISKIVIDEAVPYSRQDLIDAQAKLSDHWEELGICTAGIRDQQNSLMIGALGWTPERQQAVREIAGIDNILFRIEVPVAPRSFGKPIDENKQEAMSERQVATDLYVGGLVATE